MSSYFFPPPQTPYLSESKFGPLSIWRPIPPTDYVVMGHVVTMSQADAPPSTSLMRCVHKKYVTLLLFLCSVKSNQLIISSSPSSNSALQRFHVSRQGQCGVTRRQEPSMVGYPCGTVRSHYAMKSFVQVLLFIYIESRALHPLTLSSTRHYTTLHKCRDFHCPSGLQPPQG